MTDRGTAEAVHLLLAELEATVAREHDLRRALRSQELNRKRLTAALDPAIATLPAAEAERLRNRLHGAVYARALITARAACTRLQAIMEYLAANSGEVVKVAESRPISSARASPACRTATPPTPSSASRRTAW